VDFTVYGLSDDVAVGILAAGAQVPRQTLRGKQPKLSENYAWKLHRMRDSGDYTISDLVEHLSVSRPTI